MNFVNRMSIARYLFICYNKPDIKDYFHASAKK